MIHGRHARTVKVDFDHGDVVYLRVDIDGLKGMVTAWMVRSTVVMYEVTWGNGSCTTHMAMELSTEPVPEYIQDEEGGGQDATTDTADRSE